MNTPQIRMLNLGADRPQIQVFETGTGEPAMM